ncbi:hypothetical protein BV25DRAFT_1838673 [Artomyces pyxidatus]|uniref:Uncharacterized protein n=1 Tax=Artomyces pyxidatus TaxID=48021 RepID=A0ACB8T0U6_9AGAM|nr:hypothetical protein BV25DRAFT_1838673 [Artomyces pyxidatus]
MPSQFSSRSLASATVPPIEKVLSRIESVVDLEEEADDERLLPRDILQDDVYAPRDPMPPPFDPDLAPAFIAPSLDDDLRVRASDIADGIRVKGHRHFRELQDFHELPPAHLSLRKLETMYKNRDKRSALAVLQKPSKLDSDDKAYFHLNDPMIRFIPLGSHIDLTCAVPSGLGLGAILPALDPSALTQWQLKLDVKHRHRQFRANKVMLGCDPTGSMLYVGQCKDQEVWIALKPKAKINYEKEPTHVYKRSKEPTHLSEGTYRVLMFFLAWTLHKAQVGQVQTVKYPSLDQWDTWKLNCSLMNQDNILLSPAQAERWSQKMKDLFEQWYANAPESYKAFGLEGCLVLFLSLRYGQNFDLPAGRANAAERNAWREMYNWRELQYFTFAFASTIG